MSLLSVTLLFEGLSAEELEPVAKCFEPEAKAYPLGMPLIESKAPLRLILSGTVQLPATVLGGIGPVTCTPYSVLGAQSVCHQASGSNPPHMVVLPTSHLRVLELPYQAFNSAFPPGSGALQRIRRAGDALSRARALVSVMLLNPTLANASASSLYQLLFAASVQSQPQQLNGFGQEFYVFINGACGIQSDQQGANPVILESPTCVGVEQLFQPLEARPRTWDRVVANGVFAVIPGRAVERLARLEPSFSPVFPALNHRHGAKRTDLLLAYDSPLDADEKHKPRMGELSQLLARTMASYMSDYVLLLQLRPPGEAGDPVQQGDLRSFPSGGWMKTVTADAPPANALEGLIEQIAGGLQAVQGTVDFTVIDASALSTEQQRSYAVSPIEVVFLTQDPSAEPPIEYLLQQVRMHFTAVLFGGPPEGIGMRLQGMLLGKQSGKGALKDVLGQLYLLGRQAITYPLSVLLLQNMDARAWPVGTVVLRLSEAPLAEPAEDGLAPTLKESMERWARAVTGRRVGIALGGGGAYGFAHVPLINRLVGDTDVPIDVIAGSSFGTLVGAYFCGAGIEGVNSLASRAPFFLVGSLLAPPLSTAPLRWMVSFDVGMKLVSELDVPLLPVVTNANASVEWAVRNVTLGLGVQASGSLPPFTPTIVNNHRYLDGGIAANVPVDALRAEGARLIIASNPVPMPAPQPSIIGVPILGPLWQMFSPIVRISDGIRMMQVMSRKAGLSQMQGRDVVPFNAPVSIRSPLSFLHASEIIHQAEHESDALNEAVSEAENKWFQLQPHSSRIASKDNEILVKGTIFLRNGEIAWSCRPVLLALAEHLKTQVAGIQSFQVSIKDPAERSMADAVMTFLKQQGVRQLMTAQIDPTVRTHHIRLTPSGR